MQPHPIAPEFIAGAISCQRLEQGLKPWRLNADELPLYATPEEVLLGRAECAAGVRIRLTTDGDQVGFRALPIVSANAGITPKVDLVIANRLISSQVLDADAHAATFTLPADRDPAVPVELWLPHAAPIVLTQLLSADGATLTPAPETRRRWLTYGSSITQCASAHSPSRTWPGTAARQLDLALTCMGFGGNCHIETMVGRTIRDARADIITLKLGINVQGGATLSPRTFEIAVIGLVRLIREKHPDTPIGVISPIISPPRETTANAVGLSLTRMRAYIADAVQRLQAHGDSRVWYFDGLDQFAADQVAPLMPDQLHPNGDGYEYMGRNIANHVLTPLLHAL